MESPIIKRSIVIAGRKTSVSLENEFWTELRAIAAGRNMPLGHLIAEIDSARQHTNLSSALRVFVLGHVQAQASKNSETAAAPPGQSTLAKSI